MHSKQSRTQQEQVEHLYTERLKAPSVNKLSFALEVITTAREEREREWEWDSQQKPDGLVDNWFGLNFNLHPVLL